MCEYAGKYLMFNCAWTNDAKVKMKHIIQIYYMIPLYIKSLEVFQCYKKYAELKYELRGLILYWLNHYVCAFKENEHWIFYDDVKVTKHRSWEELVAYLIKNHYRPVGLMYHQIDNNKWNNKVNSNLTNHQLSKDIEYYQEIEDNLALIDQNTNDAVDIPLEETKKEEHDDDNNKEEDEKESENTVNTKKLNEDLIMDAEEDDIINTNKLNEQLDLNKNEIKREKGIEASNTKSDSNQPEIVMKDDNYVDSKNKDKDYQENFPIRSIRTNEWECSFNNCGYINQYSEYHCGKCKQYNEIAKMVYEKDLQLHNMKLSLNQNLNDYFWKCKKCSTINPNYESKCRCGMTKEGNKVDKQEQSEHNNQIDDNKFSSSTIICSYCHEANKAINTLCVSCKKELTIVNSIEDNQENKNEVNDLDNNPYAKCKEDEWVCEHCFQINDNRHYRCSKCKMVNQVIFDLIQEKQKFEAVQSKQYKHNNNHHLLDIEKEEEIQNERSKQIKDNEWICDYLACNAKNTYDHYMCRNCCHLNNNILRLIRQKEMYDKGQIIIENYQVNKGNQQHQQKSNEKSNSNKQGEREDNVSNQSKCKQCTINNSKEDGLCVDCLAEYFKNSDDKNKNASSKKGNNKQSNLTKSTMYQHDIANIKESQNKQKITTSTIVNSTKTSSNLSTHVPQRKYKKQY